MSIKAKAYLSNGNSLYKILTFRFLNPFTGEILRRAGTKKSKLRLKKEKKWKRTYTFLPQEILEIHILDPNGGDLKKTNIQNIEMRIEGEVLEIFVNHTEKISSKGYFKHYQIQRYFNVNSVVRDFHEIKIIDQKGENLSRKGIKWTKIDFSSNQTLKIQVAQFKPF